MPITSVVPKAMFPLVDSKGRMVSVLHSICLEAASAGVEEIGVVISPWQQQCLERYFEIADSKIYGQTGVKIKLIIQQAPAGFGDAVLCGVDFVGSEPFLLLLGDHIYFSNDGKPPCITQVTEAFASVEAVAMVGMQVVGPEELSKVGTAGGISGSKNVYRCTSLVEKPTLETARRHLVTEGLGQDTFLAHCGIYSFGPEIFECLQKLAGTTEGSREEIELTKAQRMLLEKYPEKYFLYKIDGRAFDTGTPEGYARTFAEFRSRGTII